MQLGQATAVLAKKGGKTGKGKGKKCKKGYVKKGKQCVSNAPIPYGKVHYVIPSAGKYKLKIKPSGKALGALKKGKTLKVKLTLEFTPTGTTTHILSTTFVNVHLKPHKAHKPKKGHKHKK